MIDKIKKFFLYAGVECSSYEKVKRKIVKTNQTMVAIFSGFATFFISVVYIVSHFVEGVRPNQEVYGFGLICSLVLFISSYIIAQRSDTFVTPLVDASYMIFFMYGIAIGAISNPSQQTVTFMVMLVFVPILFIDRPYRMMLIVTLYIVIFILLCIRNKTGAVLSTDIMDAIIFGLLGMSSGSVISHIKIRRYILEQKLQDVSRFDRLTQLNNRNAFELEVDSIPKGCKDKIACLYIDVNGLHEINNDKGHAAGDEMLKYISEQIRSYFGDELTYRIGGDEFIAFVPDPSEAELRKDLADMISAIEEEGYHIATGLTLSKVTFNLSMDALVKTAESIMYKDKKQYYKNFANDRQHRI